MGMLVVQIFPLTTLPLLHEDGREGMEEKGIVEVFVIELMRLVIVAVPPPAVSSSFLELSLLFAAAISSVLLVLVSLWGCCC